MNEVIAFVASFPYPLSLPRIDCISICVPLNSFWQYFELDTLFHF